MKKVRRKFKDKIPVEKEVEILEQYGRPFSELSELQEEKYFKSIGRFFMYFSILETALDHMIITTVSDRGDEPGYRIIKYLEFRDKINLAKDEYQRIISFLKSKEIKIMYQVQLSIIIKKLEEISEFRNKIAHANWGSLDRKGFVRVKTKENKEGEGIHFEKLKISPSIIYKFTRQINSLASSIDLYKENLFKRIR